MSMPQTDNLHPGDGAVQQKIEAVMLHRLGGQHPDWQRVSWDVLAVGLGRPALWRKAKPDAVRNTGSGEVCVAKRYAQFGELTSGHRRKIVGDALRLLALRDAVPDGNLVRCGLAVPIARLAGDGRFPPALRLAAEITPVTLLHGEREGLREASGLPGLGQLRTKRASKAEAE